jgi:hypothetical protein
MMDQLIARFMDQLEEAVEIGRNAQIQPVSKDITHVYVAGLGGLRYSVLILFLHLSMMNVRIPFLVRKGYHVPVFRWKKYFGDRELI